MAGFAAEMVAQKAQQRAIGKAADVTFPFVMTGAWRRSGVSLVHRPVWST